MRSALCLLALAACATGAVVIPAAPIDAPLPWLQGCWETKDGVTVEHWQTAAATHMFGHSVTLKDDAVVFFEQLRIQGSAAGLTLSAYPRGLGPTAFVEVERSAARITFSNDANDYPQRITYAREGDVLRATITMADGSRQNDWRYQPCD
jgi:hypothetical protein